MDAKIYQFRRDRFEIPGSGGTLLPRGVELGLIDVAGYSRQHLLAVQLAHACSEGAGEGCDFGEAFAADQLRGIQPGLLPGEAVAVARDIRAWLQTDESAAFLASITPEELEAAQIRFRLYEDGVDFSDLPSDCSWT